MLDIKKLKQDVSEEVQTEQYDEAKRKVKTKLKELLNAQKVVRNVERELEDIYLTIGE